MAPAHLPLPDLPVRAVLPEVARHLEANRPLVLQAPPGSGKTTLTAPFLLAAPWLAGRRIVLLEPRRLAARAAARHMARLLGEEVGGLVGYQMRLERRMGPATRIEVLTEGLLVQRILHDPSLSDTGLIIFDEFHERSLAADFGLALALEVRRALRPDLRLLAMSATIDAAPLARHLGEGAVVSAAARVWPVETRLEARNSSAPLPAQAADAVCRALEETAGGVLLFLPGEGEIRRATALLRARRLPPEVTLHPLYGALPRRAQDAAIEPPPPGGRKVVLATAIAESSLTIEDVRVVIDGGWMRVSRFSPRHGMSRLETIRVSADRAAQRRGRAGRLGPGVCYRLWDAATDRSLAPAAAPEMLDADLAPLVLQCADWGVTQREGLPWLTPPPDAAWRAAVALLRDLDALDDAGCITPHGRAMAALPAHPRLAHMVQRARQQGAPRRAVLLAAAVGEAAADAVLRHESDARRLLDRLDAAAGDDAAADGAVAEWVRRVRQLARQWSRPYPTPDEALIEPGRLLAWAFPDRIAQRRDDGGYRLANGHGAALERGDALASAAWLAVAELQDDGPQARIRLAAPLEAADIETDFAAHLAAEEAVTWSRRDERVTAVRRIRLGALTLREAPLREPAPAALLAALLEGIRLKGVANLPWSAASRNLQARILFLRRVAPEEGWPDVADAALAGVLAAWLGPFLEGLTRWEQVQRLDLAAALLAWLGPRRRALDAAAPTHLEVPSGSRIAVRYDLGDEPVLAVRIQEVFGLAATPRVAGGRVAVVMHLLSPAQRPVQVTADLASFWRQGYALVRKELRGRYPKHDWPEDPAGATPSARRRSPVRKREAS